MDNDPKNAEFTARVISAGKRYFRITVPKEVSDLLKLKGRELVKVKLEVVEE